MSHTRVQFGLAPMEGVTDFPARVWFGQASAPDFMWTPFLRVTDTFPGKEIPTLWCPEASTSGGPAVIPQLMATNAPDFARVAEQVLEQFPGQVSAAAGENPADHAFVDLNCGCPSPVVVGGRAGSALLEHPDALGAMLDDAINRLGPGRVSVKVRTGFASADEFPAIIEILRGMPLRQVTVHGRTRPDRYLGRARYDLIELAARQLEGIPVTGSGDICDMATAKAAVIAASGATRWIVGRGALRNPWIFEELRTGRPVNVPLETICRAVECFAWLHDLYWNDPDRLLRLWRDGVFEGHAGVDPGRWAALVEKIQVRGVVPGRRACSRTKMIWNYFRSSLPVHMRDGGVLRGNSVEALEHAIKGLAGDLQVSEFTAIYDASWDWVYNGSGRPADIKVPG